MAHQKRHRVTAPGYRPTANPAQAAANRERARSSAAGSHDSRPRRQRTRHAAKRAALRDW